MVGLLGFGGELVFESVKFIIMILLLVAAVIIGGKLRKNADMKKAAREAEEVKTEDLQS